jgi:nicotinamidase-related amidase
MTDPATTALVVVDVQQGFDDASWGARNNPDCEGNIAALIQAWRDAGGPIVFVRHDSRQPGSPLHPTSPGNALKPIVAGEPHLLVEKSVHSAFHGSPDLAAWLREHSYDSIAVCGITTSHCCETTARVGSDLGFDVTFVLDATHAFDFGGLSAEQLARATAANLDGEFAHVVSTAEIVEVTTTPPTS